MAHRIYDEKGNADLAALIAALRPSAIEAELYVRESRALAQRVPA